MEKIASVNVQGPVGLEYIGFTTGLSSPRNGSLSYGPFIAFQYLFPSKEELIQRYGWSEVVECMNDFQITCVKSDAAIGAVTVSCAPPLE